MGGNTGNFHTQRISATGGTRTIYSLIADGTSAGGGGFRRTYAWYKKTGNLGLLTNILSQNRPQWSLYQR
jgi:hypothetical protein